MSLLGPPEKLILDLKTSNVFSPYPSFPPPLPSFYNVYFRNRFFSYISLQCTRPYNLLLSPVLLPRPRFWFPQLRPYPYTIVVSLPYDLRWDSLRVKGALITPLKSRSITLLVLEPTLSNESGAHVQSYVVLLSVLLSPFFLGILSYTKKL